MLRLRNAGWLPGLLFVLATPGVRMDARQSGSVEPQFAVEGEVFNAASSEPVAGASVSVARLDGASLQRKTVADASGRFSFSDLPAGRYWIESRAAGFVAWNGSQSFTLTEASEAKSSVDVALAPAASISGTVLDREGKPVSGVYVEALVRASMYGVQTFTGNTAGSGMSTGADGNFKIVDREPGTYYLRVRKTPGNVYYPGVLDSSVATPVKLAMGDKVQLDFMLPEVRAVPVSFTIVSPSDPATAARRYVSFSNFIERAEVEGALWKPSGSKPVSLVGFNVSRQDGDLRENVPIKTEQIADNKFQIKGLAPGKYEISVRESVVCTTPSGESTCEGPYGRLEFYVPDGDVVVEAGTIVLQASVSVPGKIAVSPPITADLSKTVILLPAVGPGAVGTNSTHNGSAIRADGAFDILSVTPGSYMVTISGLPAGLHLESVRYGGRDATYSAFDVSRDLPDARLEINVAEESAFGKVTGTVRDINGRIVRNCVVVLMPVGVDPKYFAIAVRSGLTDQLGRFAIETVRPGEYRAFAFERLEPGVFRSVFEQVVGKAPRVSVMKGSSSTVDLEPIR